MKLKRVKLNRRNFINLVLSGSLLTMVASIIYPIIEFVFPPKQAEAVTTNVVAGKVGELVPNSGKIFKFGNKPGILINTPEGELRAFTAICTHLDCTVQYRSDYEHIWCACHNGHFDLFGKNIAGPPPSPLEQYNVNIVGEDIIVSKV